MFKVRIPNAILFFILVLTSPGLLLAAAETIEINPDLAIIQLTEQAWLHTSYLETEAYGRVPANGLLVFADTAIVLIDTPWNDALTADLFDWVSQKYQQNIDYVIATHFHADCMGGLAEAHRRGAHSYAVDLTRGICQEKSLPLPQQTFSDSLTLSFGRCAIELRYLGAGHTFDNIVVWLPSDRVLFGGCLVKSALTRDLGNMAEADLTSWPNTLRKLKTSFPLAKIVVPGHGAPGSLDLIDHTIQLCQSFLNEDPQ